MSPLTELLTRLKLIKRSIDAPTLTQPSLEYVIMTAAGHRPSGLADAFGGYLCACRGASWSHSPGYGPNGGCAEGWYDAREFLARYRVRDGAE